MCTKLIGNNQQDQEGQLVHRLRAKDPEALTELYKLYGRLVYTVILRIVNHPGVAEDLAQESFLRAWNRSCTLHEDCASVGPWLISIARHWALDYRKSSQCRLAGQLSFDDQWVSPITIHDDLVRRERSRALALAMLGLPAPQRHVIELAYFDGLSQSEIAVRLHEPLGTVKSWTRAALQRLRHKVERSLVM